MRRPRPRPFDNCANRSGQNAETSLDLAGRSDERRGHFRSDAPRFEALSAHPKRLTAPLPRLPVHPRRRGEHIVEKLLSISGVGSSPQARGTPHALQQRTGRKRFIPAGAGNTQQKGCKAPGTPVHPRRRGEHSVKLEKGFPADGSSPQARGTRGKARCCSLNIESSSDGQQQRQLRDGAAALEGPGAQPGKLACNAESVRPLADPGIG